MSFFKRNFTGYTFITKLGKFSIQFAAGVFEEITLNVTVVGSANGVEVPENLNFDLLSKDKIITISSMAITSRTVQSGLFNLIADATVNLLI
jgi:hypothetical protein